MEYKIDYQNKVIFGSTPKAGCNHVKRLYLYYNEIEYDRNTFHNNMDLPHDYINKYKVLLFIRNPYKRIVSGFIEKIIKGKIIIPFEIDISNVTFEYFIDYFYNNRELLFNNHHFNLQTFHIPDDIIIDKIYDIENIDYNYIDSLYDKKINDIVLHQRGEHNILYCDDINEKFYNIPISNLKDIEAYPTYDNFFNDEILKKVHEIYEKDFNSFYRLEFDYQLKI